MRVSTYANAAVLTGCCLLAFLTAGSAHADTIKTFDASGSASGGQVGGTLTVDTTNGLVQAADITIGAPVSLRFTHFDQSFHSYGGNSYELVDVFTSDASVYFYFSISPSLTNFNGGYANEGNLYYPGTGQYGASSYNLGFSLPVAPVTPAGEPRTLASLAACFLAFLTVRRRLALVLR